MEQADGVSPVVSPVPTKNSAESKKTSSMKRIASILSMRNPTSVVMKCVQLGISRALLEPFENRDILYQDFFKYVKYYFPSSGSEHNKTPKHPYGYFKFKDYSPLAFRYFRDAYSISTEDYSKSLCEQELKELSSSGRSGSIFFKTYDDLYVLKSLERRESYFLRRLLAGYYINIKQHLNTLLPKYFGFYFYSSMRQKFRMCVMNNLLPSTLKLSEIYDIKGSTHNRRANSNELAKSCPTFKDLDLLERRPKGFLLPKEYRDLVFQTLTRDTRVLEGFEIMDYSLLIGVHNITKHTDKCPCGNLNKAVQYGHDENIQNLSYELRGLVIDENLHKPINNYQGGIPVTDDSGEKYLIFIGIIDILQTYRFAKKLEHNFKSMVGDGKTISVCNPTMYKQRFMLFLEEHVFLPLEEGQIAIPPENIHPSVRSSPLHIETLMSPENNAESNSSIFTEDDVEHTLNTVVTENGNTNNSYNRKNNTRQDGEEFLEITQSGSPHE